MGREAITDIEDGREMVKGSTAFEGWELVGGRAVVAGKYVGCVDELKSLVSVLCWRSRTSN